MASRVGSWAASVVVVIGLCYIVALAVGFGRAGLDQPIVDPVLYVMEALTLLSAPPIVIAVAAIHVGAPPDRTIFSTSALAFAIVFAGITSAVHFVELTAVRQMGEAGIAWPSPAYAAELLAWDWFLGLALICAGSAFGNGRGEVAVRRGLLASGVLAFAGTVGPLTGDMRLQRIGIVGYALVMPLAFFLLARFFRVHRWIAPEDHEG